MNDLDLFGVSNFFQFFAYNCYYEQRQRILRFEQQNEAYMALWCAGIYDTELSAPTITQVRQHEYYTEIDFMKLLLRGYDLRKELDLDINEMLKQYSEADGQRLFGTETKYTFLRKNDPKILNDEDPDILNTFSKV